MNRVNFRKLPSNSKHYGRYNFRDVYSGNIVYNRYTCIFLWKLKIDKSVTVKIEIRLGSNIGWCLIMTRPVHDDFTMPLP